MSHQSSTQKLSEIHAEDARSTTPESAQQAAESSIYRPRNYSSESHPSHSKEAGSTNEPDLDFLDFLAVAQWRQIDFLPITWQQSLSSIGLGGTARLQQSLVNVNVSLAFKRLRLEKDTPSARLAALQASINEVSVLGHSIIRRHPNIIRLEGICWDITENEVWPVLAFKKAQHGDLRNLYLSEAGRNLSFEQKLQICSEIASAVMSMHSFHVIHGDLKPENVLIFDNEHGRYTAAVGDFGYSGLSLDRSEDSQFDLPISRPWNSPEVNEWVFTLPFFTARKSDIYSFGLLSIWILFRDHLIRLADERGYSGARADLDMLQDLKQNDRLFEFAMKCAEDENDLTDDQVSGLALFFSWTLVTDFSARRLPNEYHEAAEQLFGVQKDARTSTADHEEDISEFTSAPLTSLGIMYTDIHGYRRPFGYLHYYSLDSNSEYSMNQDSFNLTVAIPDVVLSDYRLWIYLVYCNEARYHHDKHNLSSKRYAAFQIALLSKLGLNVLSKTNETSDWLLKSGRSQDDIDFEIEKINTLKHFSYRSVDIPLDLVDHVEQYRSCGLLAEAQDIYENTISCLKPLLGSTNPLFMRLKVIHAQVLQGLGDYSKAEQILTNQIDEIDAAQLSQNAETIAAQMQLVSIYIDSSRWKDAQKVQIAVLETSMHVLGEESQQVLTCRDNLAVIYWNLQDYEKAEEILTRQLRVVERSRGKRHKRTLTVMNNLASTYEHQGRFEAAMTMQCEAVTLSSAIMGENHHVTLSMMNNLASNYRRRGMLDKAEQLDIRVVDIRKKQFGETHPMTLLAMGNLASSYALQDRAKEAEPLERHIASQYLAQFGPRNAYTLTARNNLAHTVKDLGRMSEAIELMTDVVAGRTEVLGPSHTETKKSVGNLRLWREMISTQPPSIVNPE